MDQDQISCAVMSTDQNVCSFSNKGSMIAGLQKHDFKTTPNNLLISITPFNLRQENTLKKKFSYGSSAIILRRILADFSHPFHQKLS